MPRWSKIVLFVALGFIGKIAITEATKITNVYYVDKCFESHPNATQEQKTECYSAARKEPLYQVLSVLNFQPEFFKNTKGRCDEKTINESKDYFECGWWNKITI